jgi:hypothetical protein
MDGNNMNSQENKKKPLAYLDQNIYSEMRSNIQLKTYVKDNFTVLYSDNTLDEFEGKPELTEIYLSILNEFDNMFIEHALDENYEDTDHCRLVNIRPIEILSMRAQKKSDEEVDPLTSMLRMAHKHFGGLKGTSFEAIAEEQREKLKKQIGEVEESISDESEVPADLVEKIEKLKRVLNPTFEKLKEVLHENIADQENYRGPKEHREKIGLGPNELNNLKPPRVIEQILAMLMSHPDVKGHGLTPEKIFGFEYVQRKGSLSKSDKIGMIYQWLNFMGFNPDSRMERENRMRASFRDQLHASLASFASVIFTRDEAFAKKLEAIYEYLEIPTAVVYLDDDILRKNEGESDHGASAA